MSQDRNSRLYLCVNCDSAGSAGEQVNSGNRRLPSAGSVHIGFLALIHVRFPPLFPIFGLLGCVIVLAALENLKSVKLPSAKGVLSQHALNGKLHGELGTLGH